MSKLTSMLLLPLAALCVPASAQQAPATQGAQGMVVVRDAQTGQLRAPTAAELRSMQPAASATKAAPVQPAIVTGPGGRRSVRLGESHMVYSVVQRDAEGKLGDQCVQGEVAAKRAAERAAEGATQPVTRPEEHRHESR